MLGFERRVSRAFSLETTGFWYEVSDLISRSGADLSNVYQNSAEARIRGLELAGSLWPVDGLLLNIHVTWTDGADRPGPPRGAGDRPRVGRGDRPTAPRGLRPSALDRRP